MKSVKHLITSKPFLYIGGIIFVFVLWTLISIVFDSNSIIFPSPIETFKEFFLLLKQKYIYSAIGFSFLRLIIGFGVSFALALILGSLAGNIPHLYNLLSPLMAVFKTIPTASVVFLFIVLSGSRDAPIYVVIMICLPILYEAVVGGIKNVSPDIINAARVDGANKFRQTFSIKLPLSFPYILVGVASSFALSFKVEIMAEIITGYTGGGLGCAIRTSQAVDPTNMKAIFAISLIAIILILLLSLVNQMIRKKYAFN